MMFSILLVGSFSIKLNVEHKIRLVRYPWVTVKLYPSLVCTLARVLGWNGSYCSILPTLETLARGIVWPCRNILLKS